MRKAIILLLATITLSNRSYSQNIQLNIGEQTRIFAEQTFANDNTMFYGYLEATHNGGAYGQFIIEQKFWKPSAFIHAEYRTYFGNGYTLLAGAAYSFYGQHGLTSLSALYRYDGQHSPQISVLYNYDWGWCDLYGYADFWGITEFNAYSETRFYIKVVAGISMGTIVDLSYLGKFAAVPYFGIRYKF